MKSKCKDKVVLSMSVCVNCGKYGSVGVETGMCLECLDGWMYKQLK